MFLRTTCVLLVLVAGCGSDASSTGGGVGQGAQAPAQSSGGNGQSSGSTGSGSTNGNTSGGSQNSGSSSNGSSNGGSSASSSDGCTATPASGNLDLTIMSGGMQRTAHVHIPSSYVGTKPTPVLLNFHGRMTDASQQELISGTTPKSDKEGFVVVYPNGIGETWNAGLCCGDAMSQNIDDVQFTRDLLDTLESKLCVDKKRVFATGLSNGAFMSDRLACELADRIAAIGPVAGQLLAMSCSPSRPVPVMEFHGTSDPIVSYTGGLGMPSVQDAVKGWATRNGCGTTPMQTYSMGDATCNTYSGCKADADVTLCVINGGGHTWPGGFPIPGLGKTSTDINATDALWDFFTKHPMP